MSVFPLSTSQSEVYVAVSSPVVTEVIYFTQLSMCAQEYIYEQAGR